jgi:RNA polymerase sigma factor (sigma-70 family)
MDNHVELAETFERCRHHLRAVAFRMLGSAAEADDAVQEAWLRASAADAAGVVNMAGWLTTIVSRVCLDMLRSRRRLEAVTDAGELERLAADGGAPDPEGEAALAESVGLAMLVVLDALGPAERVAFVLHDLFGVSFADIAAIVDRTPSAAKKLASRARRRVHATPTAAPADIARHAAVIEAFLAASRAGDLDALLAVLAPDVVRRADRAALRDRGVTEVRGARRVAEETLTNTDRARFARAILVDGAIGIAVAPRGRLSLVLAVDIDGERISAIDVIADPARLRQLHLAVVDDQGVTRAAATPASRPPAAATPPETEGARTSGRAPR